MYLKVKGFRSLQKSALEIKVINLGTQGKQGLCGVSQIVYAVHNGKTTKSALERRINMYHMLVLFHVLC